MSNLPQASAMSLAVICFPANAVCRPEKCDFLVSCIC